MYGLMEERSAGAVSVSATNTSDERSDGGFVLGWVAILAIVATSILAVLVVIVIAVVIVYCRGRQVSIYFTFSHQIKINNSSSV